MFPAIQPFELPTWAFRGWQEDEKTVSLAQQGAPRSLYELLADAAVVHHFTGNTPWLALHLPTDQADDYQDVAQHAAELGLGISSLYPKLAISRQGVPAISDPELSIRRQAVDYLSRCAVLVGEVGARRLVLQIVDSAKYPGRREFYARRERAYESLIKVAENLPAGTEMLLNIRQASFPFGGDSITVPDWMTSLEYCYQIGPDTRVLFTYDEITTALKPITMVAEEAVITAVSAITHIFQKGRLGGLVAAISPPIGDRMMLDHFGVFVSLAEAARIGALNESTLITIDPSPHQHAGMVSLISTVLAIQEAWVKVTNIDFSKLHSLTNAPTSPEIDRQITELLLEAYEADVSVKLHKIRREFGIETNPLTAFDQAARACYIKAERHATLQRVAERRLGSPHVSRRGRTKLHHANHT